MVNSSLTSGKDGKLFEVDAKENLIFNEKNSEKIKIPIYVKFLEKKKIC